MSDSKSQQQVAPGASVDQQELRRATQSLSKMSELLSTVGTNKDKSSAA